jgi:hypothetical protein
MNKGYPSASLKNGRLFHEDRIVQQFRNLKAQSYSATPELPQLLLYLESSLSTSAPCTAEKGSHETSDDFASRGIGDRSREILRKGFDHRIALPRSRPRHTADCSTDNLSKNSSPRNGCGTPLAR